MAIPPPPVDNPPISITMSSPPPPHVGFDEIARMIRDLSLGVTSPSKTLIGAVAAAGCQVKSSFVESTGRKKRTPADNSITPLSDTPATNDGLR